MHKFLIHNKRDHVGVAITNIRCGEQATGIYMDDGSMTAVVAKNDIPSGHKISIADIAANGRVVKYGLPIGYAPEGLSTGEYVHTHNLKTARW